MAKSNRLVAAEHAGRKANCSLPGDLFGRDLEDVRRLCPGSGCRDRFWRQVAAAMAARDVRAGETWVFRDHRTMAEVSAENAIAA
jgi:hypothetical protein